MGGSGKPEVISSNGCSKLFSDISYSLGSCSSRDLQNSHSSKSSATSSTSLLPSTSNSPFSGLVICVTGLSKEARKQVMDATERLGGEYSPRLHPQCTHLVVQSSRGHKFDDALKHGTADGLFIVKIGWFVDSVKKNVRLNESLYALKSFGENFVAKGDINRIENAKQSNLIEKPRLHSSEEHKKFSGQSVYDDASAELQNKVIYFKSSHEKNQSIAILAKEGVRNRRMQRSQMPIKPLTRSILLGSICWSVSEPSSTASFVNFSQPLSESEKNELVSRNHFVTILFPVDRFAEMGPCSRTFFSNTGFTCSQLLDHIYAFYQENMLMSEIEVAIHTDSRYANRLRSMYSTKVAAERGYVELKRLDFLGSRKRFEMLKHVPVDNNNVYELFIRA